MAEQFISTRNRPVEVIVRRYWCKAFTDPTFNQDWCEISVPPALLSECSIHPWGTIIVKPEFVYNTYNKNYYSILLTPNSKIKICYKDDSFARNIIRCEYDYSEGIVARVLQYEAFYSGRVKSSRDDIKSDVYRDYKSSKRTMLGFIESFSSSDFKRDAYIPPNESLMSHINETLERLRAEGLLEDNN